MPPLALWPPVATALTEAPATDKGLGQRIELCTNQQPSKPQGLKQVRRTSSHARSGAVRMLLKILTRIPKKAPTSPARNVWHDLLI